MKDNSHRVCDWSGLGRYVWSSRTCVFDMKWNKIYHPKICLSSILTFWGWVFLRKGRSKRSSEKCVEIIFLWNIYTFIGYLHLWRCLHLSTRKRKVTKSFETLIDREGNGLHYITTIPLCVVPSWRLPITGLCSLHPRHFLLSLAGLGHLDIFHCI